MPCQLLLKHDSGMNNRATTLPHNVHTPLRRAGSYLVSVFSGLAATGCCLTCSTVLPPSDHEPPDLISYYGYEIVQVYPHDPEAFTQGLDFADGHLYESTGLHGASSVRKVALESGEVLQKHLLPRAYFGEGLAAHGDRLVQLTWRSQVGFVYGRTDFEQIGEFSYLGEGWGLAHDEKRFIMSDGTSRLRGLDLNTFQAVGSLHVRYGDQPVKNINELEYIDGKIYANIWRDDKLVIICPESGYITGWVDLSGLLSREEAAKADVLNGIAWDDEGKRLFVTGKRWPKLFEIRLIETRTAPYPAVATSATP